eukprot:CFRG8561T1
MLALQAKILRAESFSLTWRVRHFRSSTRLSSFVNLHSDVYPNETSTQPPLVVIHGLFGSNTNWKTVSKVLAQEREVHTIDLRNHGGSPHSDEMSFESLALDVVQYIERRGIKHADIMGHSLGGKTAMVVALNHPSIVRRLIVVDMSPVKYKDSQSDLVSYAKAIRNLDLSVIKNRKDASAALAKDIPDKHHLNFMIGNLVKDERKRFRWKLNVKILPEVIPKLAGFPDNLAIKPFTGPTLFCYGTKSTYYQPQFLPEIEGLFSDNRLVGLEAGHWVHAEKQAEFIDTVKHFLN